MALTPINVEDLKDTDLIYKDVTTPLNIYDRGLYSSDIAELNDGLFTSISARSGKDTKDSLDALFEMVKKDPKASQCLSLKSLRAVQSFGAFKHPKKEVESFVQSNLSTLPHSLKSRLFVLIATTILTGSGLAEFSITPRARGFRGQWRLSRLNVLDPRRIINLVGKKGRVEYIEYDNGSGSIVKIPYKKCLHLVNNKGVSLGKDGIVGVGDGEAAINYFKLKKAVLTQLAVATKNNSSGLIHIKAPNTGKTILVDSRNEPLKDSKGAPLVVSKQIALNYQLRDIYKQDYIVTDPDVILDQIRIQSDEGFWRFALDYIDRAIEQAFGIPTGIFDSGMTGVQNVGLSQNFKSIFDATIFGLTDNLKQELIHKIIKPLLFFNFPFDWVKDSYGEFAYEAEEDQDTVNSRLTTITSLIASGLLDQNDPEVLGLIRKNLGLPALTELQKEQMKTMKDQSQQIEELNSQMQELQLQMQMQQMMAPPPPPEEQGASPDGTAEEEYPE